MNVNSARFQARQMRLNAQFQQAMRENNPSEIVRTRFAMLGYSYDDSGSGSALASIIAASASLGSAAILASNSNNSVSVPTRINPAYGAAQPVGNSTVLLLVVGAAILVGGLFFAMRA